MFFGAAFGNLFFLSAKKSMGKAIPKHRPAKNPASQKAKQRPTKNRLQFQNNNPKTGRRALARHPVFGRRRLRRREPLPLRANPRVRNSREPRRCTLQSSGAHVRARAGAGGTPARRRRRPAGRPTRTWPSLPTGRGGRRRLETGAGAGRPWCGPCPWTRRSWGGRRCGRAPCTPPWASWRPACCGAARSRTPSRGAPAVAAEYP